ncbi:MAG: serine--tRNA ligase, partial [Acetobacteraceae bacterium]|nr:serine--tRNA ligase [Acetobacteraceae bacterium]
MHDIKVIRADPAAFDAALARRGLEPASERILELDQVVRAATQEFEAGRAELKLRSREVGRLKAAGKHDEAAQLIRDIEEWEERQAQWLGNRANEPEAERDAILSGLPNILDPEVPDGADESANVVLHQQREVPNFAFAPKQHFELGEALGLMDFGTAAKLAGARFTVLKGALARLERALGQWMIALHADQHGYTEASVPLLVNDATMHGTGQ